MKGLSNKVKGWFRVLFTPRVLLPIVPSVIALIVAPDVFLGIVGSAIVLVFSASLILYVVAVLELNTFSVRRIRKYWRQYL